MKILIQKIKTNSSQPAGFSLVEVVVAIGVMGLAMAAFSSLYVTQARNIKRLEIKQDLGVLATEVQSTILSGQSCKNAIADGLPGLQSFNLASAEQPSLVDNKPNPDSNAGQEISFALPNGNLLKAQISTATDYEIPGYPFGVESLKFYDAIQVGTSSGNPIYKVGLYGVFGATALGYKMSFGPKHLGTMNLVVDSGSQEILGCFTAGADQAGAESMCKAMGGSFDLVASQCKFTAGICNDIGGAFDATTGQCQISIPSVADVCTSMGGTFNATTNQCSVATSASGSGSTPTAPCTSANYSHYSQTPDSTGRYPSGTEAMTNGGCGENLVYSCINGQWYFSGGESLSCGD